MTDVVAARDAALWLVGGDPLAGLLLLMGRQLRLAAELHTLGLRTGATARRAPHDAASFELGGNPKHGEHQLGEVGRGVDDRLGE
jgi:hypothetical protein